jgi:hypothetical protein
LLEEFTSAMEETLDAELYAIWGSGCRIPRSSLLAIVQLSLGFTTDIWK